MQTYRHTPRCRWGELLSMYSMTNITCLNADFQPLTPTFLILDCLPHFSLLLKSGMLISM